MPFSKTISASPPSLFLIWPSIYLFCTRKGQPYSEDGFDSIWQRTVRKLVKKNPDFVRFRFNDIRHKAATDAETDHGREFARRLLVHADQRTTAIYVSGVQRIKPPK